jgi:hypothetical protein
MDNYCEFCAVPGKVSATERSVLQRSPTDCTCVGVTVCMCVWMCSGVTVTLLPYNE